MSTVVVVCIDGAVKFAVGMCDCRCACGMRESRMTDGVARCLQIEECVVEFNAKINSVTSAESSKDETIGVEASIGGSYGPVTANVKASYSSQSQARNSNTETREYSMRVLVRARQAPMPEGLKRILDILAEAIKNRVQDEIAA
jgi:hypothetical protein